MTCPPLADRRIAVVTTSGGSGILAADALEAHRLALAALAPETTAALDEIVPAFGSTANPVDVTASVMSNGTLFDRTLDAIADDPGVDGIVACFCVLTGKDVDDVVSSLSRVAERSGKPVVAVRTGADHLAPQANSRMRAAGIPCYQTPRTRGPGPRRPPHLQSRAHFLAVRGARPGRRKCQLPRVASTFPTPRRSRGRASRTSRTCSPPPASPCRLGASSTRPRTLPELSRTAVAPASSRRSSPAGPQVRCRRSRCRRDPGPRGRGIRAGRRARWPGLGRGAGLRWRRGPGRLRAELARPGAHGRVGGVLTEVFNDVALRLLPVTADDVEQMVERHASARSWRASVAPRGPTAPPSSRPYAA